MTGLDALSVALASLAAGWAIAAGASWRAGARPAAAWFAAAAGVHVVAAAWSPSPPLVIAAWLACGLSIPARRLSNGRKADRNEKWTLQWLAATVVLALAGCAVAVALHYLVDVPHEVAPWLIATLVLIPLGQAFAASPHVRQSAELVLVESVVVAVLALFVVAVYLVVVVGLGHVPVGGERNVLVSSLFAAVVIAVLALPVRQRALALAGVFVGDRGASAEQILATLGARMTRAVPMDELLLQITESLHSTIATAGAEIWVGQEGTLTRAVSVPRRAGGRLDIGEKERTVVARARMGGQSWSSVWLPAVAADVVAANGVRPDLRVAPISHLGELLGLVVVRRRADSSAFSDDDERLLLELARQLGLALHNVRLDSALQASLDELKRRNAELQASRLRIVTAADESRRSIERNLHDGAQQYLVALAVKLNIAGQVAADDPAEIVDMLEELRGDVQATIRELRELAHGIYPPLLRDRGLGEALRTAASRSPLPCTLEVELAGRYPQDVETAVYFCCLEALQNAGKHAGDQAQVSVRVGGGGTEIWFEVQDDGMGFAGNDRAGSGFLNMQDRLGAVGGRLDVMSSPGAGTTIRGSIPAAPLDQRLISREGSAAASA
ncbi:MAG: histidine kinase [Actinomycetota bacterium]